MELKLIKSLLIDLFNKDFSLKARQRPLVYMRAVYFKLCRDFTPYTTTEIGASVNRDHATVLHGLKLFKLLKEWGDDYYLEIYTKARLFIKQNYKFGNPHLKKSYKEKYTELLLKHILLKEKYKKIKTTIEKIS